MIQRIVDFSLNNRFLILVIWALIAALGIRSLGELPIDAVPDVTNVQVQVLTNSPGIAPQEMERFITFPVETAMSGLPRVSEIRSVSKFGLSVVTIVFDEGTDIYWARQLVSERLSQAKEGIPSGYGEPEMGPISTGLGEIYQFELRGEGYNPMELRSLLDWVVNFQLRSVKGVVEVNSFGGELKTYQITIDPSRLTALGISLSQVFEAVEKNNRNVGGGYIAHANEQYLIRGEGLIESLDALGNILVTHDEEGTPVFIKNLGKVEFAPLIRQGAVTRDGRGEAVIGIVMMLMGANSREVSKNVHEKVLEIQKSLPDGVVIDTFYDRTELVDRTIKTVATNLAEGGFLVIVVLLLLLGSFKAGLIVASAIPFSMLAAFIAMRAAGVSGNLMSLGAIDFGLIVDGSVVLIENVVRYLHDHRKDPGTHLEKVRKACNQVARPVVFAVGIIMIVYIPILGLRGIEGKMFGPMALTVVFALIGSLICALTLMPVLASIFLRNISEKEPFLFRIAKKLYQPILTKVIKRPLRTVLVAISVFLLSVGISPFLGAEFLPRLDEGAIALQVWRIPSISLEKSNEISTKVEKVVLTFPEVKTIISRTGRAEIATDPMGVEISDTYLMLKPKAAWRFPTKEKLIIALNETLEKEVPGVVFSFSQPIELRVSELISGVRSDVAVKLFAPGGKLEKMKEVADEIVRTVSKVPGMTEVKAEQITGLPTVRIRLDRREIARLGINVNDVLDVVETIGGKTLGNVLEGQKRFAIQARFDPRVRSNLHILEDLKVAEVGGDSDQGRVLVPLGQIADITIEEGPAQISRENISRRISIEANVRGRDLASAVAEARKKVAAQVEIPTGWWVEWGGQFENLEAASKRLGFLVPLAMLLIFVLLYSTFQSIPLAALIFLNVPLAVTGGIFALWMRGYPFSISGGVGFIALLGVAVLNGVVLVSYIVQLRTRGVPAKEAAAEAAKIRLRPVLMTAMVASLGFVPMALATSAGAEVQRPLATVVIGGLITSTLLTLLVLPSVYGFFAERAKPKKEV